MKKIKLLKNVLIFVTLTIAMFLFNSYSLAAEDYTVYVTLNGSKYHLAGCDYLDGRPYPIKLSYAQSHGYGPCKHCKPYQEEADFPIEQAFQAFFLFFTLITFSVIVATLIYYFLDEYNRKKLIKMNSNINLDEYRINNKVNQSTQEINTLNKQNNIQSTQPSSQVNFPMAWYGFWIYFRFPVGIITVALSLFTFDYTSFIYDKIAFGLFILDIAYLLFVIFTYIEVKNKGKHTVKLITILCIVDGIMGVLNQMITDISKDGFDIINFCMVAVALAIFTILNYIYFNKRRSLFKN